VIIGLDVDEVLLQLHDAWLKPYNEDFNDSLTAADIVHWDIHEIVKQECGAKIFHYLTPSLYALDFVQPYPEALAAVELIRSKGHSIAFVTSCGPKNEDAEAKEAYLTRHGFRKPEDLFIPGRDKSNAPVDILVTRPHNIGFHTHVPRVNNVAEFALSLL
jgi:5'(3')-deoxyribonucleotidase